MHKLKRIIACLALTLGMSGVAITGNTLPASAGLSNCEHYSYANYNSAWPGWRTLWSYCSSSGTYTKMTVLIKCTNGPYAPVWVYGNTVTLVGANSTASCASGQVWTEGHVVLGTT